MLRASSKNHLSTLYAVIAAALAFICVRVDAQTYTATVLPVPSGGYGTISGAAYALNNLALTNASFRIVGASAMLVNGTAEGVACYSKYGSGTWPGTFLPTGAPTGCTFVSSEARGVNNAKTIVGDYTYKSNTFPYPTITHACYWKLVSGVYQLTDIGTLGGTNSYAYGINTVGDTVGTSDLSNGNSHACYWKPASTTIYDLGTLGGNDSAGYAINDSKDITGWADDASGTQWAILGTPDSNNIPDILTSLGTMVDDGYTVNLFVGFALNNQSPVNIVGARGTPPQTGGSRPFYDVYGVNKVTVPTAAASLNRQAFGVNNDQRAVGYVSDEKGAGFAWYWDYDSSSNATELPGSISAYGINDKANGETIVGTGQIGSSGEAVVWTGG